MLNECDKAYDCLVTYFQDEFWETIFFNHFYYFIKMQNLFLLEIEIRHIESTNLNNNKSLIKLKKPNSKE